MTMADRHFSPETGGAPKADGRFVEVSAVEPVSFLPGLDFQPVLGEDTMVNFVHFAPNTEAPRHAHAEEQIVIVLEGEFDFELAGERRTMRPGDVAVVPSWVPHSARTRDIACYEADVFNPPRETLLDHARSQREREVLAVTETEIGVAVPASDDGKEPDA
jgi:quercetin dioxygenase-like cupin family protein